MALLIAPPLNPAEKYLFSLSESRIRLLHEAEAWPDSTLKKSRSFESWSALELIDHLTRVERVAMASLRKESAAKTRPSRNFSLRRTVLFAIMRSSLRVAVPKQLPELHPEMPASLTMATSAWDDAHDELLSFVRPLAMERENHACFRHPVGGWMNVTQLAEFLDLHLRHHQSQWVRLQQGSMR
jgi:hypothetical protein